MANEGDEVGKIFVGGLTRETTDDMLRSYFAAYGEINESESIVMRDKLTQVSRGFGFVKFNEQSSVAEVLKNRPHMLDNKKIDPKPCTPKSIQQQKKNAAMEHTSTHKIFVGGIAQNTTEEDVKTYFEQYGTVNEVIFVINNEEKRHKGFGFVTFEDESAFNQAVDKHFHEICGKRVEARKAVPREKQGGGRGGMGRPDGSDGYEGLYTYGYANQGQGGFMPPQGNGMMEYGYQGYGTTYPQGFGQMGQQSYYGYNYNPAMGGYGGMGQMGKTDNGSGAYGGMGGNYQQQSSGYGPASRGGGNQAYGGSSGGAEYGNGYGRSGGDTGGKSSGQGYHPYKR
ncbi:DAZ-associated protein 1-like [Styela clava]|uniref:DAZ-associated protein 1-like n=1 Tax=Styela clava TaxID=7725 RepID=UPI001939C6A5|nr:DAZ-associated protein 1-like [Styela clava]